MENVINFNELAAEREQYMLVDIRDTGSFETGHIEGALNLPEYEIQQRMSELPKDRCIAVYCRQGDKAPEAAEMLRENGFDAVSVSGGYIEWLMKKIQTGIEENRVADIERSIQKKFHRSIFSKFTKAITDYQLIQPNDHIAVCISGGKDSMLMAKLFQELHRYSKYPFELTFIVMDPGYSPANRALIEGNAGLLNIPIEIFETDIFGSVYNVQNNPCYLCARMRRGHLYNRAKELGCNKIALGHHYDDIIETILMSMIYGGQVETMMPKVHSANFEGMQLIRPMYLIREAEIKHWCMYNDLHFIQCACRFTDNAASSAPDKESTSNRREIKKLIAKLAEGNPQIEKNIFRSVEGVNLNKIISYKKDGVIHHFLDEYEN